MIRSKRYGKSWLRLIKKTPMTIRKKSLNLKERSRESERIQKWLIMQNVREKAAQSDKPTSMKGRSELSEKQLELRKKSTEDAKKVMPLKDKRCTRRAKEVSWKNLQQNGRSVRSGRGVTKLGRTGMIVNPREVREVQEVQEVQKVQVVHKVQLVLLVRKVRKVR